MLIIKKLQKSIFSVLNSKKSEDTAFMHNISGIYHFVPQNALFPYIYLGENDIKDLSNFVEKIYSIDMNIYIFDREKNNENSIGIAEEIKKVLLNKNIEIDDADFLDVKLNSSSIEICEDGESWKVILNFNFLIKERN